VYRAMGILGSTTHHCRSVRHRRSPCLSIITTGRHEERSVEVAAVRCEAARPMQLLGEKGAELSQLHAGMISRRE
jgi:hypothetical protein